MNEIDYNRNTLKNYYFWKNKERELREKAMELQDKVDDEREIRGINCEKEPSGKCSGDTPYINKLIIEQATYQQRADNCLYHVDMLDTQHRIGKKVKQLNESERQVITMLYAEGMSYANIANRMHRDVKTIRKIEFNAIKNMNMTVV